MKQEVIEYFNSINGKSLTFNEIAEGLKNIKGINAKNVLENLKSSTPKKEGNFKGLYKLKKPRVAMLKSKRPVDECNLSVLNAINSDMLELNKMLLSRGAHVPKIYSIFFADSHYIEIQDLKKGKMVGFWNPHKYAESKNTSLNEDRYNEMYSFNAKQQKLMLSLPQKAFDDLLNTHLILKDAGCKLDDCHSENVLVTKSGFTIVDLDYDYLLEQQRRKHPIAMDINTIIRNYLRTFTTANSYLGGFTMAQRLEIQNNNVKLLQKVIKAVENKGINFDFDYFDSVLERMVGKGNMRRLKFLINKNAKKK